VLHGFTRAGTTPSQGTFVSNMSTKDQIAGFYCDADFAQHGFLRRRDGDVATLDVPGGGDLDAGDVNHGFLRTHDRTPACRLGPPGRNVSGTKLDFNPWRVYFAGPPGWADG